MLIVVLPLVLLSSALVQEAAGVYARMQSGEINFGRYFRQVFDALPAWATSLLERYGMADFQAVQERASAAFLKATQYIAGSAVTFGQGTLDFVVSLFIMLYLVFFLLRDGDE